MTTGLALFLMWMKLMGSHVELDTGTYVDSMGAVLNPEMVEVEGSSAVQAGVRPRRRGGEVQEDRGRGGRVLWEQGGGHAQSGGR
ncbi:hypothetical protein NL676_004402 [Syzygium grande]|nr:hypothetical protein NL676_004402 [Syzygium grande]